MRPEDADDFSQQVHLRLLERNYAPVTMFAGRSSFRTYLFVVIKRMLLDWRNSQAGKWRPSASAKRLGPAAVALDRLISRDGHSRDEAIAILEGCPSSLPARLLRALAERLPRRSKRQLIVPEQPETIGAVPFEDPIEIRDAATARRQAVLTFRRAYAQLPADDRHLLYLRFQRKLTVAAIAELLGTPSKPLYRRIDRLLRTLRLTIGQLDTMTQRADDSTTAETVVVH
jgi:RNA polymerase sigma factor (sigma-70 family)